MHIMCVMFVKYSEPGVVALQISSIIKQLAKKKFKKRKKKKKMQFIFQFHTGILVSYDITKH